MFYDKLDIYLHKNFNKIKLELFCVILTVVTITGKVEEEELFRQRFEPGTFLSAF
jgi:hypothetical protein